MSSEFCYFSPLLALRAGLLFFRIYPQSATFTLDVRVCVLQSGYQYSVAQLIGVSLIAKDGHLCQHRRVLTTVYQRRGADQKFFDLSHPRVGQGDASRVGRQAAEAEVRLHPQAAATAGNRLNLTCPACTQKPCPTNVSLRPC